MTVRVYKSSDPGAPQLSSTANTLIDVLNGCLVTGYGSKAAAGWTRPYNDTNVAVFKQGEPSAKHSHYLRVYDPGSTSARVVGYETMTDANTGTNPFPSEEQFSGGLYWYKPTTTTTRPWMVFANERTVYVWWAATGTATTTGETYTYPILNTAIYSPHMYYFGDFVSYDPGEKYSCLIIGSSTNGVATNGFVTVDQYAGTLTQTMYQTHFVSRPSINIAQKFNRPFKSASVTKCCSMYGQHASTYVVGSNSSIYAPYNTLNRWYLSRIQIIETVDNNGTSYQNVRGELPGLYGSAVNIPGVEDTHTITSPNFPGKVLMCKPSRTGTYLYGYVFVETSNTW